MGADQHDALREALIKLQRQYADFARIDYFKCPQGSGIGSQLEKLARTLLPESVSDPEVRSVSLDDYKGKIWGTRPQPHVDRIACIWLIRRFTDRDAVIRYSFEAHRDEIAS